MINSEQHPERKQRASSARNRASLTLTFRERSQVAAPPSSHPDLEQRLLATPIIVFVRACVRACVRARGRVGARKMRGSLAVKCRTLPEIERGAYDRERERERERAHTRTRVRVHARTYRQYAGIQARTARIYEAYYPSTRAESTP